MVVSAKRPPAQLPLRWLRLPPRRWLQQIVSIEKSCQTVLLLFWVWFVEGIAVGLVCGLASSISNRLRRRIGISRQRTDLSEQCSTWVDNRRHMRLVQIVDEETESKNDGRSVVMQLRGHFCRMFWTLTGHFFAQK